ncbi:hypothetical protein BGZ93_001509 [Podila epicladia]|nr:hypothetical protein BGZ93_001509 [Podila epicladia]
MNDLKVYDSCLFWSKAGAVNLKPEGNSWDDDMTIQSKDPAWVRNSVQPPIPTNQELLILPPVAKIERSIEVFYENSHLYPPFITKLIVERAKKTRSNQVSRILLNTIAGIAIRIDPDIENQHSNGPSKPAGSAQHKQQYMRYFQRAYGLLAHLEDIRSTYSTTYLQATLLLCYVYPKPQLRVELLKLMTEAAFLGLHVDASRWMPKPIVIQNRCWLFWACYMFDSIHHVIRGQLTQMDDHYLDAPFPALTELDHDDGLWTRWFMLKEINLWRIGRKVYSFFQAGLKRMDRTIEASNNNGLDSEGQDGNSQNIEDILESEYSEAELIVSLKMWQDDLPLHLQAQLQDMDRVDPRVNGRAIGLQAILSMLRILLLYPNMLAIGTKLLDSNLPKKNEYHHQYQQQILQQQHHLRRQDYLDKIMQCVQEADRLVHLASIILDRYPERARMTCLGAALDWCLRIYYKVVMEKKTPEPKETDSGKETSSADPSVVLGVSGGPVFSSRLKSRCRVQVIAVAKLLKRFQSLDHKYFFSWLTIELESLEEYQQAAQERMIRKVVEEMEKSIQVQSYLASSSYREPQSQSQPQSIQTPPINLHHQAQSSSSTMGSSSSLFSQNGGHLGMFSSPISTDVVSSSTSFDSLDQLQQQYRPKMHDLQAVIQKRQQQGIYASPVSGMTTTPSSTNSASIRTFPSTPLVMPTSNSSSSVLSSQQQQQRPVVSPGVSFIGFSQPTPTSSSLGQYTSSVSGSMSMPTSVYHFDHNTEFSGPSDVRVDSQLNPVLTQAPLYIYPQTSQPTIVPSQQQQQQLLSQPVFENQHMYFSHSASSSSGMGPLLAGSSMVSQGMQPVVLSHTSAPPFPYAESQQQEDQYQRQYSGSEAPYYG